MDLEHVEPVQSLTRGRRSRTRGRLAVAIPGVLLIGVVAVGVIGRVSAPNVPQEIAVVPDRATPAPAPPSSVPDPIIEPPELDADGFPIRTIGLSVLSVDET